MNRPVAAYDGAATVTRVVLQAILEIEGARNVSRALLVEPKQWLSHEEALAVVEAIRSIKEASLFPVGAYQLLALRFVVEDEGLLPVTLLLIKDYARPAPVLVDGHIFDQSRAIEAWLGESNPSDHPELKLAQ